MNSEELKMVNKMITKELRETNKQIAYWTARIEEEDNEDNRMMLKYYEERRELTFRLGWKLATKS